MKTFNFTYTVTPKEGDDSWWIDIRKQNFECDAETLDEAKQKFVEMMSDKWCVEISKSAAKRPEKMYRDRKNMPPQVVGYVYTGHYDVDWGNGEWKNKVCWVWTEIREMEYPEELAA